METVVLNDGTKLLDSHVLLDGNTLWFYLKNITFEEAFELMNDSSKTSRIIMDYFGDVTEYNGYTDLFCLKREEDMRITGGLKHA